MVNRINNHQEVISIIPEKVVDLESNQIKAYWHSTETGEVLIVDVLIDDGNLAHAQIKIRDYLLRKTLDYRLKTLINGNIFFIKNNKKLINSKIIVNFKSRNYKYQKVENWGIVGNYV